MTFFSNFLFPLSSYSLILAFSSIHHAWLPSYHARIYGFFADFAFLASSLRKSSIRASIQRNRWVFSCKEIWIVSSPFFFLNIICRFPHYPLISELSFKICLSMSSFMANVNDTHTRRMAISESRQQKHRLFLRDFSALFRRWTLQFQSFEFEFVSEILHFGPYSAFANFNSIVEPVRIVHLVEQNSNKIATLDHQCIRRLLVRFRSRSPVWWFYWCLISRQYFR